MNILYALYYRSLKPEALYNAYLRENGKKREDIIAELYMGHRVSQIVTLTNMLYDRGKAVLAREIQKQVDKLQGRMPLGNRIWQNV